MQNHSSQTKWTLCFKYLSGHSANAQKHIIQRKIKHAKTVCFVTKLPVRVLQLQYQKSFSDVFLSFLDRSKCGSKLYGLRPLIACLPAWWRFAQSLRRYNDTKQKFPHVANAGKYATTFFVVFFSTVATTNKGIMKKCRFICKRDCFYQP